MCVLILCVSLESDSEVAEELLKPGHLSRLLEEDLSGDVSSLSLPEVNGVVTELLERLRSYRDDCKPHQLQVSCTSHIQTVLFVKSSCLVNKLKCVFNVLYEGTERGL